MGKIRTLISLFTTKSKFKDFFKSLKGNKGFSLIEILVAVFLVVSVLAITNIGSSNPSREKLENSLFLMERAIRFSHDESILRNAVTRIHFFFDKEPQEFSVEYGPDADFIIPLNMVKQDEYEDLSESEKSKRKNENEEINREFNTVDEFHDDNKELEDGIRFLAMGTTINDNIITEDESAIYVYPNGEKDGAIIVFSSYDEVASISFEPFSMDFKYNYYPFEQEFIDEEEKELAFFDKAKEIVGEWIKNK